MICSASVSAHTEGWASETCFLSLLLHPQYFNPTLQDWSCHVPVAILMPGEHHACKHVWKGSEKEAVD